MRLGFSETQASYDSGSQQARVLTEAWVNECMFCPNCGNPRLRQFEANRPLADFVCDECEDQFELKSQKRAFGSKLANGAYDTKLARLRANDAPNLMLMQYDGKRKEVINFTVVPKRFFVASLVEKRKPLGPNARRAGWVGSNILLSRVPEAGRVSIVRNGVTTPTGIVLSNWRRTAFLESQPLSARGWLIEVMTVVDTLGAKEFTLQDVYRFEDSLQLLYPSNNNVRPKIRQQLQVLRDNGYLEFLGNGRYRKALS